MNRLWFLTASRCNQYMTELLEALGAAARRAGVSVQYAVDAYPEPEGKDAYVVIPHEFFECAPEGGNPSPEQLARTVGVCVEQPGTMWFEISARHAERLGQVLDINPTAAVALTKAGIRANHLQLGYAPEWDHWGGAASARTIDVLYMGSDDPRRAQVLGGYADTLSSRTTRLLIASLDPGTTYLAGAAKYRELARTRLLMNLHREGAIGLFSWLRALEAISNGCVLISEHSLDHAPLLAGEHFLSADAEHLALLADGVLADQDRLATLRSTAYEFVRAELTMDHGIGRLLDAAERAVSSRKRRGGRRSNKPALAPNRGPELPIASAEPITGFEPTPERAALKHIAVELLGIQRRLDALERGSPDKDLTRPDVVSETPAFATARPRISVLTSLYNYEREVIRGLRSVARSTHDAYEVLVLDDASRDNSVAAARRFLDEHPWIPARLLRNHSNQGVSRVRNMLASEARGELLFMLDADNEVFPDSFVKLERALRLHPDATFAYGIVAVVKEGRPVSLVSVGPWDPQRLRESNYIDVMVLLKAAALKQIGGFCEDIRLTGWEDYDLWLRIAEQGLHAVHVPEIIGRYNRAPGSLLASFTNIDTDVARSMVRARSPKLFSPGAERPRDVHQPVANLADDQLEMQLEEPPQDTTVTRTRFLRVKGWVAATVPIERVSVCLGEYHDELRYGVFRPDVAAVRPHLNDPGRSGYSGVVDLRALGAGPFRLEVTAHMGDGQELTRTADVRLAEGARLPQRTRPLQTAQPSWLSVWVLSAGRSEKDIELSLASAAAERVGARVVSALAAERLPETPYVVLLRAGAALAPGAIAHLATACVRDRPGAVYGDDLLDADGRPEPFFKPGFSPDLLAHSDYIGPLAAIRTDLVARARELSPDAQSPGQLVASLSDEPEIDVHHVPRVLCVRYDAVPAIAAGPPPTPSLVCHPLVSIVVPTAATGEHLGRCLGSIAARSTYAPLEVVIVANSSGQLPDLDRMLAPIPVEIVHQDGMFNHSTAVNRGVQHARGEYLMLLNDDVEVLTDDWLERLLDHAMKPGVGVVGAKLERTDRTLQDGGMMLAPDCAVHQFEDFPADSPGYHGLLGVPRNCSAVTGACMLVSAAVYRWLGGLDDSFVFEHGDVDFCLRVRASGMRVVWTPHAVLRHDERATRGMQSPTADVALFRARWGAELQRGDPYYNPNLSTEHHWEPLVAP